MSDLEKLFEQKNKLRNPQSYFQGVTLDRDFIPDNLVCFMHDYSQLHQNSTQYFIHHRFLIVIPLKGEGVMGIERDFFKLKPGRALLVFPFQLHFFPATDEDAEWLILSFESGDKWLKPLKNQICKVSPLFLERAAEASLLYLSVMKDNSNDRLRLIELFRGLLQEMLSSSFCDEKIDLSPKWQRAYNILRKVDQFVEKNIKGDISATAIAEHFKLAKNYLAALFKSNFGITLGQYVTNLKVQKATELLLNTDMQMIEIAEESGFDNPVSFNRAFKRLMRFPPGKYRAMFSKK